MYLLIEEVLNYLPIDNLEVVNKTSEFKKVYNKLNKRFKSKKSRALYAKCIGRNSRLYISIITYIIDFVNTKIKSKNSSKASQGGQR